MLIRFFLENFLSFNEQIELSMIPGKSRLHPHHVIRDTRRKGIDILKSAVLYGANASGKSNLVEALAFARKLIVKGTNAKDEIQTKNFKLDKKNYRIPSKFQFDIKSNKKMFSYGFSVDRYQIHKEWLYEISKFKEKLLFERSRINNNKVNVKVGNITYSGKKEKDFLEYVALGTRPNQLFLTESIQRNVKHFMDIYDWFDKKLTIIFPSSVAKGIEFHFDSKSNEANVFLKFLRHFDTGISSLKTEKYNLDKDKTEIPESVVNDIRKNLKGKNERIFLSSNRNDRYTIYRDKDGQLIALKLISKHKLKNSDEEIDFQIYEESDGTQRILDLLPALVSLINYDRIFVIDELDRSLHPLLIKEFIELFLEHSQKQKSQLIVTTHDSTLLDLKTLRKDEIWFIEKNQSGESQLYSLEEFRIRYDKNIKKDYLKGRYGAIPIFMDLKYQKK